MTDESYSDQAAGFIAEAERIAALNLPQLPDDPEQAAAMRKAGYDVLAECTGLEGARAIVCAMSEDEEPFLRVLAAELAVALGVPVDALPGTEFLATLRETPKTGPVLSAFRPLPARGTEPAGEEVTVACLLLFGDQAELARDGGETDDTARWPAAVIAEETGLRPEDLPGKRFRVRVTEEDGRVLFSGFRLLRLPGATPPGLTSGAWPRTSR